MMQSCDKVAPVVESQVALIGCEYKQKRKQLSQRAHLLSNDEATPPADISRLDKIIETHRVWRRSCDINTKWSLHVQNYC